MEGSETPELESFETTPISYYFTVKYRNALFDIRVDARRPEYEVWRVRAGAGVDPSQVKREFEALVGGNPLTLKVLYAGRLATLVDVIKQGKPPPQPQRAVQGDSGEGGAEEKFPVHEIIKQIKGKTLYRSKRFWRAVVLAEDPGGRRSVRVYLWRNKDGKWKVSQKLKINTKKGWEKLKKIIDEYVQELAR